MSVPLEEWIGPEMNKIEQVSSDDHQMSLGGYVPTVRPIPMMYVMLPISPHRQNDGQTSVKTLPSHNFVCEQ